MAEPVSDREVVVVLGPGRSGTSTMAGALARCGYHVPDAIKGNESNPQGFYEPKWVVRFHKRLLNDALVRPLDGDPDAFALLAPALEDPKVREELRTWLSAELEANPRLVIKDPRLVWFQELWSAVADELDARAGFVVMLRHPAEVSSSRSEFYDVRESTAVGGWINVALLTERLTRGLPRSFVRYADLLADWRPELTLTAERLGITLDPGPEEKPHPVDDFIDPSLRRRDPDWAALGVPDHLSELGDRTYAALGYLADEGDQADVTGELEAISHEYATVHSDAVALVNAHLQRWRREGLRQGRREGAEKARAELTASRAEAPAARSLWDRITGRRA